MSPELLIVDDDDDLRAMLEMFIALKMNTQSVSVSSLAELERKADEALACTTAIIDINLGADQPSGIDVFDWLKARGFKGKVAFLTGHADTHPLVKRASLEHGVRVYKKPMEVDDLVELVKNP